MKVKYTFIALYLFIYIGAHCPRKFCYSVLSIKRRKRRSTRVIVVDYARKHRRIQLLLPTRP